MTTTMHDRREIFLTEIVINKNLTIVQMPDLRTFDFHVEGDNHYLVHFLNPNVFGKEFATLSQGYNLFTTVNCDEETQCLFFDDIKLRTILMGIAYPRTGPIVIPPRQSGG